MQTVGEKLRKARLEQNLSFEEVYKQTKIYPHVLEALEQDRAHNFLSFVYIKGFLKTYARYLGLDGEKLLKEYVDSQNQQPAASEVVVEEKKKEPFPVPKVNLALILRASAAILLFFGLIFYFRYVKKNISTIEDRAEIQRVKVEVTPASAVKSEDLVVEVRTKQDCWIRVRTDNQAVFEKILPKGKTERWRAKENIELRIGKPEALMVFLNGKPIDLQKAKVKKGLVITHAGVTGK